MTLFTPPFFVDDGDTPNLGLSLMKAAQVQTHVTHNETLQSLDAIVQLSAISINITAPPSSPSDGDTYIIGSSATGDFSGHDKEVVYYDGTNWLFHTPKKGWLAWDQSNSTIIYYDGSAWANVVTSSTTPTTPEIKSNYNHIENGDFLFWDYGTVSEPTQGTSGRRRTVNRWSLVYGGGDHTRISRESFSLGQTDVPTDSPYFFRITRLSSSPSSGSWLLVDTCIENVALFSEKTFTLTYWARSPENLRVSPVMQFLYGVGGSSPTDIGGSYKSDPLSTSWRKEQVVINLPSVSGKTITDDNCFWLSFFISGGDDSLTESLGAQVGTIDLAHISLVEGDRTSESNPFYARPYWQERALCDRFYQKVKAYVPTVNAGDRLGGRAVFTPEMRTTPTVSIVSNDGGSADPTLLADSRGVNFDVARSSNEDVNITIQADTEYLL